MKEPKPIMITEEQARKVISIIDAGLCSGIGTRRRGNVCVEAAVCLAFKESNRGDRPSCVHETLRNLKIGLNDNQTWEKAKKPKKARAQGLRRLGVVQLGSVTGFNEKKYNEAMLMLAFKLVKDSLGLPDEKLKGIRTLKKVLELKDILEERVDGYTYDPQEYALYQMMVRMGPGMGLSGYFCTLVASVVKTPEGLADVCEQIVQILVKLKVPGAQWLPLTEEEAA